MRRARRGCRCAPCASSTPTGDSRSRRTACGIPGRRSPAPACAATPARNRPARRQTPPSFRSSSFSASTSHEQPAGSADRRKAYSMTSSAKPRASMPCFASRSIADFTSCATLRRDRILEQRLEVRDQFEGHNPRLPGAWARPTPEVGTATASSAPGGDLRPGIVHLFRRTRALRSLAFRRSSTGAISFSRLKNSISRRSGEAR